MNMPMTRIIICYLLIFRSLIFAYLPNPVDFFCDIRPVSCRIASEMPE